MIFKAKRMTIVETIYMPSKNGFHGETKKWNGVKNGGKFSNGCYVQPKQSTEETGKTWENDFCECFEETPMLAAISTYIGYLILVAVGHVREFLKSIGIGVIKGVAEPKIPVSWSIVLPKCSFKYYAIHNVENMNLILCVGADKVKGRSVGDKRRGKRRGGKEKREEERGSREGRIREREIERRRREKEQKEKE